MRRLQAALLSLTLAAAGGCDSRTETGCATGSAAPEDPRVVALAPHLAELAFAVGAGDSLVATSAHTDFPGYAPLPVIGDAFAIDQERLAVLAPDLLLAWRSGTPAHVVDELREQGYCVEVIRTRTLDDVPAAMERIGRLTGRDAQAARAAATFREGVRELSRRYTASAPVRVFFQISERPLYTINGAHFVSDLIEVCGGENVFADLNDLAPLVDVEAVLARDPEVLITSSDTGDALDVWERWPHLAANRFGNRFVLPADEIARATPRLLQAGEMLCEVLETARRNRTKHAA